MMVDFVKWALTDGQKFAAELGYAPLPAEVVKLELAALAKIKIVVELRRGGMAAAAAGQAISGSGWGRAPSRSSSSLIVCAIGFELTRQSMLSIQKFGFSFWRTEIWDPVAGEFGALPVHLGHALFVDSRAASSRRRSRSASPSSSPSSARHWLRQPLVFLTELLAAIPSIVYGLWGIFVLVPAVRALEAATARRRCAQLPLFSGPPLGVGMLAAGADSRRSWSFRSRRRSRARCSRPCRVAQREGAYALGATRFEAIRAALFYARTGIVGAVMLGLRPRARRDDGRDDGDWQQPAGSRRRCSRRSTRWRRCIANEFTEAADDAVSARADRNRPGAVRHHADRQLAVAAADLEHGAASSVAPATVVPAAAGRRAAGRMNGRRSRRQIVVGCSSAFCAAVGAGGARPARASSCSSSSARASGARTSTSSRRCRSRSASPAAAWPTPSSAR